MNTKASKSFLELKSVWQDDHMFELQVKVSNGRYAGRTEVYETKESLFSFAQKLIGYPENKLDDLFYELGEKDSYAYCSINFYIINTVKQVGLEIHLEENVATEYRKQEKDKLKLEIIVEAESISKFQKELSLLATNQNGTAILYGKDFLSQ